MNPSAFHWSESNIESISVTGRELSIIASGVFPLGGNGPVRVRVVFQGVASANLETTEYVEGNHASEQWPAPYVRELLPAIELPNTSVHGLEGVSTFPPTAWLDLEVKAQVAKVEAL